MNFPGGRPSKCLLRPPLLNLSDQLIIGVLKVVEPPLVIIDVIAFLLKAPVM
jgi:hypothetical protein